MKQNIRFLIDVLKSAITNKAITLPEFEISEDVFLILKKHHITTMFFYGLLNCNAMFDDVKNKLHDVVISEFVISEKQMLCFADIVERFKENKIDYMPLKGCLLKSNYPKPEIRRMGDIDILIKTNQYKKIIKVMRDLGFEQGKETDHELKWTRDGILVELHKRLIPTDNIDYVAVLGDGWSLAKKITDNEYSMNKEDMFIYLFLHFTKHYRDAGIGIIHMCDIYIYTNSVELDFGYISERLKKLGIYEFWLNVEYTLGVWFGENIDTKISDYITEVILNSGVYGTYNNIVLSVALKQKEKSEKFLNDVWRQLFPSYTWMKNRHPILADAPVFLPFFWIVRWFDLCFKNRKRIFDKISERKIATDQRVSEYEKSLAYVGLKYDFKSKMVKNGEVFDQKLN